MSDEAEETYAVSPLAKTLGALWSAIGLLTILSYWQNPLFLTLVSSFRVQLLIVFSLSSLPPLFLFPGKKKLLFVAVPAAIAMTFLSYFAPAPAKLDETKPSFRLAVANVYSGNRDISRLKNWLAQKPVDILAVLEVAPHHTEALLNMGFEHTVIEARGNNFGIALLSKEAPIKTTILEQDSPLPSILAEFQNFQVIATHPVPPLSREARNSGDEQVIRLSKLASHFDKPTLFLGDLNATGWDMRVRPLDEMGLKDARKGHGLIPTWPVGRPIMHIPIDHIYLPKSWLSIDCHRGPDIGSDHYPLRAVIQPR